MAGIASYEDALSAVSAAAERGIGVYDMAVAFEIGYAISTKKKLFSRRKKLFDRMIGDAGLLYDIAVEVVRRSAGACTPADAAHRVVEAYLNSGMDVAKARVFSMVADFATSLTCKRTTDTMSVYNEEMNR